MSVQILFIDKLPNALHTELTGILKACPEFTISEYSGDDENVKKAQLRSADVLIHYVTNIDDAMLDECENLKLIVKYQMRPTQAAPTLGKRGVRVVRVPCIALISVAEYAVMMMLNLAKRVIYAKDECAKKPWLPDLQPTLTLQEKYPFNWIHLTNSASLYGKTVGIIGFGTIGKTVASMLKPFHVRVIYNDLYPLSEDENRELGVEYRSLPDLMSESDFITVHLRLTDDNDNLISAEMISRMKPGAFLVNTSRGRVVEEAALTKALVEKKIAGAALDVFWYEPLPEESPLWNLDNVIITPHIAGIPLDASADIEAQMIADAIRDQFL